MRGMQRRFPLTLVTFATVLILAACIDARGDASTPSPAPAANATVAAMLPTTVDALPPTDVAAFNETLDQLVGTPVVVNVWASWCDPCKREVSKLVAAAAARPQIQFLGVDVKDSRGGAEDFITANGITYPSLFDPDGAILTDLEGVGPPVTLFVAADGTVVWSLKGELSQEALDGGLAQIES